MALLNSTLPFGIRQQSSAKITVQVLDANDNDPSHFLSTTGGRPGDSGFFVFLYYYSVVDADNDDNDDE